MAGWNPARRIDPALTQYWGQATRKTTGPSAAEIQLCSSGEPLGSPAEIFGENQPPPGGAITRDYPLQGKISDPAINRQARREQMDDKM